MRGPMAVFMDTFRARILENQLDIKLLHGAHSDSFLEENQLFSLFESEQNSDMLKLMMEFRSIIDQSVLNLLSEFLNFLASLSFLVHCFYVFCTAQCFLRSYCLLKSLEFFVFLRRRNEMVALRIFFYHVVAMFFFPPLPLQLQVIESASDVEDSCFEEARGLLGPISQPSKYTLCFIIYFFLFSLCTSPFPFLFELFPSIFPRGLFCWRVCCF